MPAPAPPSPQGLVRRARQELATTGHISDETCLRLIQRVGAPPAAHLRGAARGRPPAAVRSGAARRPRAPRGAPLGRLPPLDLRRWPPPPRPIDRATRPSAE